MDWFARCPVKCCARRKWRKLFPVVLAEKQFLSMSKQHRIFLVEMRFAIFRRNAESFLTGAPKA